MARYSSVRLHGSRSRADSVIIHTSKIRAAELKRKPPSSWLLTGQGPTSPLSAYQYALTANLYLKLLRVSQTTPRLSASDRTILIWVPGHKETPGNDATDKLAKAAAIATDTPPRLISFVTAKALTNRTIADPPPNIPERQCGPKISPGRQAASPRPTGQMPFS